MPDSWCQVARCLFLTAVHLFVHRQVNCHHDVLHLLLDAGADIDKLNSEGMSALAVCHVLYYPFHCLHAAFTELPNSTQVTFYLMAFFLQVASHKTFLFEVDFLSSGFGVPFHT